MKTFSSTTIFLTITTTSYSAVVSAHNNEYDQCADSLPQKTSAHPYETNYMFTREKWLYGGPPPNTKCFGQSYKQFKGVDSTDECAKKCATIDNNKKRGNDDGLILLGFNYNCYKVNKCECIWGNEGDNLDNTVEEKPGTNWACYKSDETSTPSTSTPTPTPSQCELTPTITVSEFGHTFTQPYQDQHEYTSCKVAHNYYPTYENISLDQCAKKCAAKVGNISCPAGRLGCQDVIGFDYICDRNECTCLTGSTGSNLMENVRFVPNKMACYQLVPEGDGDSLMDTKKYLRANVIQTWNH